MPPESVGFHSSIVGPDTSIELVFEIEPPHALPIIKWHVDGLQCSLHLAQPDLVRVIHCFHCKAIGDPCSS